MRPSARIVTTRNRKKLENIIIKGGMNPTLFFGVGEGSIPEEVTPRRFSSVRRTPDERE